MEKVIIFDIDGTLFDTKKGIINAIRHVIEGFDLTLDPKYEKQLIGPPVKDVFLKYFRMTDWDATLATKQYRECYVERYVKDSRLYPNAQDMIKLLHSKDFVLCIATMKTLPQVQKLLEISGMRHFFETIMVAREDGTLSKSQMILEIKAKYGDKAYYMVGDTLGDYTASKAAEVNFIYARYGYGDIKERTEMYVVDDLADIIKIVRDND